MVKMRIFDIGDGKYALGLEDNKAKFVLRVRRDGKSAGVRGRRPTLTKGKYERAKVTPEIRAAFKAAIAGA